MAKLIERFNRIHWSVRILILTLVAVAFARYAFPRLVHTGWAVVMKVSGNAPHCPWPQILAYYDNLADFAEQEGKISSTASVKAYDHTLGIGQTSVRQGSFWEKRSPDPLVPGMHGGIPYNVTEQEWMFRHNRSRR
jgi:hypothetical protein